MYRILCSQFIGITFRHKHKPVISLRNFTTKYRKRKKSTDNSNTSVVSRIIMNIRSWLESYINVSMYGAVIVYCIKIAINTRSIPSKTCLDQIQFMPMSHARLWMHLLIPNIDNFYFSKLLKLLTFYVYNNSTSDRRVHWLFKVFCLVGSDWYRAANNRTNI